MTGLVILFLLIIFYMSEKIIHSYEYGYLKTVVESSFKEIYVKNGEIIVDNDMETKINTIQISVYNKNLGFVYGNNPLNFEYDDKKFLMKNFYGVSALLNNYFKKTSSTELKDSFVSFCRDFDSYYKPVLIEENGKKDFYFFEVKDYSREFESFTSKK